MNGSTIIRGVGKWTALAGLVAAFCLAGCGPKPAAPATPAKPAAAKPAAAASVATPTNAPDQYTSVFEDLPPDQGGKDPFFPNSQRRMAPKTVPAEAGPEVRPDPVLVLKAVIRTSRHSQAVINNEIMEPGETAQVRVPNGKVKVKCLEIGKNYVIVQVEGEAESKRLMMEQQKKY